MLKRFLANSTVYALATVANQGLAFVLLPLYTRYLTPADYGVLSVCSATALIISALISLGLGSAVTLYYFKLGAEEYRRMLGTVWLWLALFPLAVVGLLEACGPALAARVFPSVPWDPYLRLAIWIAYATIAPGLAQALFMARQRPLAHSVFTLSTFLVSTGLILYFVTIRRQGALGSLRGQAIGAALMAIVAHAVGLRSCRLVVDRACLVTALRLCVPILPHSLCMWTLNVSDRWVLARVVPAAELGLYSLAYTLGTVVLLSGIALGNAFGPIYYRGVEDPQFRAQLPRVISAYLAIHTWVVLAVSLLAPEVLQVMTRPDFHGSAALVPWVATGYWFFVGVYHLSMGVIQYHEKTRWLVVITGPPAALNVGLNILLVPRFGVTAAAVDTLVAFALMGTISFVLAGRLDRLPYSWGPLGRMVAFAALAYGFGTVALSGAGLVTAALSKGLLLVAAAVVLAALAGLPFRQALQLGRA